MLAMIVLGISIAILILLIFARIHAVQRDFERWKKNLHVLHAAYETLDEELMADWGIAEHFVPGKMIKLGNAENRENIQVPIDWQEIE